MARYYRTLIVIILALYHNFKTVTDVVIGKISDVFRFIRLQLRVIVKWYLFPNLVRVDLCDVANRLGKAAELGRCEMTEETWRIGYPQLKVLLLRAVRSQYLPREREVVYTVAHQIQKRLYVVNGMNAVLELANGGKHRVASSFRCALCRIYPYGAAKRYKSVFTW